MQTVLQWASTLLVLIGLALSMGANPALYGATLDMLARGQRTLPRLFWMIGGLFLGATALFALFHFFNPTRFVNLLRADVEAAVVNRVIDFAAGCVFLLLAAVLFVWVVRVRKLPERAPKPPKQNAHMLSYFTLGLSGAVMGFMPLPALYLTARMTTALSEVLALQWLAYAVFLLALGGPFVLLAVAWRRFPALTKRIAAVYTRALAWDLRLAGAVVSALVGLTFIGLAIFAHR